MITFVLRRDNAAEVARFLDRALRIALGLGMATAVAWAIAHDTAPCSVEDPSECGADAAGSAAIGLLFAVPVLLWLAPTLACAALVVFAVFDVRYDPSPLVHGVFLALGVAAVAVAVLHRRLVAIARHVVPAVPAAGPTLRHLSDREWSDTVDDDEGFVVTLAAAAGLLLAVLTAAVGADAIRVDAAHRARAEQLSVVVTDHVHDDDGNPLVDVHGGGDRTWQFGVLDFRPYPVGSTTLIAVDGDWSELVAEEHDPTPWLTVSTAAALLGLGAGWRAFAAGTARRRVGSLRVRAPRRERLQAGVLTAGAIVAGPAGVWFADTWPERVTAGWGAAHVAWLGASRWTRGFDADAARLTLHTSFWSRDLPWRSVRALHAFGATVMIADERGDVHTFGPFDTGPGGNALDRTTEVGSRLAQWRSSPPTTRRAGRDTERRIAPAGIIAAGVVAVECAAGLLASV